MPLYQLGDDSPQIPESAYVTNEATVIGNVTLGERTSVWPYATIRGDNEPIVIGNDVNIQDGAILHVDPGCPMRIGDFASIGHQAMLHGCTIGEGTLIGIQAVVMNKAVIGKWCLVGAGSIVTEGKVFPDRTLILGAPAKVVRELSDKDVAFLRGNADNYVERQIMYKANLKKIG
jgi:carbonic anhydrase/acetyltransferase-like protein (isoleucine patch superfamily)